MAESNDEEVRSNLSLQYQQPREMQRDVSRELIETVDYFIEGGSADEEEQDHVDLDL